MNATIFCKVAHHEPADKPPARDLELDRVADARAAALGPDAHTPVESQNSYVMPKRSTRGVTMPTT